MKNSRQISMANVLPTVISVKVSIIIPFGRPSLDTCLTLSVGREMLKWFDLHYLELAQPVKALSDPQIRIPRPRPMVLMIGTTAIFPVNTEEIVISNTENAFIN
jgi:hypothetical protein